MAEKKSFIVFCDRVKETEDLLKYLGAADLSKDRDRA